MNPDRWQRIQELFAAARALDGGARAGFVQRACGSDDALRAEVLALLAHDDDADGAVEHIVVDAAGALLGEAGRTAAGGLVGRRLGAWRITAHLADGGMGAVYRAERADGQYRQQAAIKLINPAFVVRQAADRLATERQILARLEHPHIARLLDGGSTDDGAPYLVMEYVDGTPIDAYCNANALDTAARLRLFQQVCGAVDYAHRNLVVHRDLKPANILVGRDGQPKLLDFGIAKLIEGTEALTAADQRVLTPTHASPEQIRGEPITTATDVYALGVLLYQLLSGRLPFAASGTAGSAAQLARRIIESEPAPPSTAVSRPGEEGSNARLAALRRRGEQLTPERLRRELQGDLDNIVLVALRKEPGRRYGSALALSDDIARYLDAKPVRARRDTLAYRSSKFVQRHRLGVLASAAAVLGVAALVGFYTWRLSLERDRAHEAADQARVAAARAEKVAEFLAGVFSVADPTRNLGRSVTARELLDNGARQIERELAGEPALQAALMEAMGDAYRNLGLFPEARDLRQKAFDARRATSGPDSTAAARSLAALGDVTSELGDYDQAIEHLRAALAILRRAVPPEPLAVSRTLRALAGTLHEAGRDYAQVEQTYLSAIEAATSAGRDGDAERARAMDRLGQSLMFAGRLAEARGWMEKGLALRVGSFGDSHPETIESIGSIGNLLMRESRHVEAIVQFERALALARDVYGDDHIRTAYLAANVGNALAGAGRFAEAERAAREALPVFRARLGDDHPRTAFLIENLANAIFYQARYDEALPMYLDSVEQLRRRFGDAHAEYGISLSNLCGVYVEMERYASAADTCRRAHAVVQKAFGPGHFVGVTTLTKLGAALAGLRQFEAADATLRLAHERAQINLPENHAARADVFSGRGRLMLARNRPAEAERLFRESLRIGIANQPDGGPPVASREVDLGRALARLGRRQEAESLLLKAHAVLVDSLGDEHPDVRKARRHLADLYAAWGRRDQAAHYRSPAGAAAN